MKDHQPMSPNKAFERKDVGGIKTDFTKTNGSIVALIMRDHEPIKAALETLKNPEIGRKEKEGLYEQFAYDLICHAEAEQRSLYVHMKQHDENDYKVESFAGDTEHAIADQLLHEINATPDDNEWLAKVKVLATLVETHIEEEEQEILPHVGEMNEEMLFAIGAEYERLKLEFKSLHKVQAPKRFAFNKAH